ncbi:ABC-type dipeptide/oligopeptide/nickel transport system, ATPase component [Corynebacterium mustelae]|uniref:ABC-type dipeptide/oligopeptide/nickel transport system, ATPase component n=1 Tax=Corynebacterium mustelae TaxID=571915 RepID=A0A0G3GYJ1_9CORY|nr:ATP-binding cassette domain-containing protein [Corynebacterium mustelae]AKK06211.1 ABC-type dipeptide/oligopeptide/nickel transport system, ATPase component [Corynebacterium mustelae]
MIDITNAAVFPYLQPTSLHIAQGEKVALLGASGAGKTTLLRLLCGWLRPDVGTVTAPTIGDFSYIPQDLDGSLNPNLRIVDVVTEPIAIAGGDVASAKHTVPELLKSLALNPEIADKYPYEISGGQRQRVGIARALIGQPKVIYADEALSALDSTAKKLVIDLLKSPDLTTVLVSHDLVAATTLCSRCIIVSDGAIVEDIPATDFWSTTSASPMRRTLIDAHRLLNSETAI